MFKSREHKEGLVLLGLGDDKTVSRQVRAIGYLNKRRPVDAQLHVFDTRWQTPETYTEKWQRLKDFVLEHGDIELVYAISAGASLGMTLVPELPDSTEYHFIAGKLMRPETIGEERNTRAPALKESVIASEKVIEGNNLQQYDMTCHVGFLDGVLELPDMIVQDVPTKRIAMVNHSMSIALAYFTILRKL